MADFVQESGYAFVAGYEVPPDPDEAVDGSGRCDPESLRLARTNPEVCVTRRVWIVKGRQILIVEEAGLAEGELWQRLEGGTVSPQVSPDGSKLLARRDPKSGESFGMQRCRIAAEAVCRAHARGIDIAPERVAEIAAAFSAAGLSLERPYLNPGSADRYTFGESRAA